MSSVLLTLVLIHIVLTIVYAADWYQDHGKVQETLIRLLLTFFLPLFGFLFFKFLDYFYSRNSEAQMDEMYLGEAHMLDELSLLRPVNREEELDKAPAVDTLKLGDYSLRRKMIMDTLKEEDTVEYLTVLKEALSNEDAETSHYASSVIMDIQKRIQERLTAKESLFAKDPENVNHQIELERELFQVIQSGAFDENNLARYYVRYKEVSDMLLKLPDAWEDWYHNRIQIDLKTGDNVHAEETGRLFVEKCPESETAVVDMIQICVRMCSREMLDEFLGKLKDMPVLLTNRSLQYIRFLS